MHWKIKAHGLAVLSRVPGGKRVYHGMQAWCGTNRLDADEHLERAAQIVDLIRETGRDPCQGAYLEIGTGWRPFLPFLLYLIGAERIITLDVNPWLNAKYAFETYRAVGERLPAIAKRLGIPLAQVQGCYEKARPRTNELKELLRTFQVEYYCSARSPQTSLPDQCVDFVCSSNVLEHVPPAVLTAVHAESLRILKSQGLAVHRFNPGDHFSSVDARISGVNFLRFSEAEWRWYGGSGLSYHNRLRCVQHEELFQNAGFSLLITRVRTDQQALDLLKKDALPIHADFARFLPEELAADYMWMVGMKP